MEKTNTNTLPLWFTVILGSIGIGAIVTTIVTCICGGYDETLRRIIIWLIASALFGISSLLIFGKDRFSLPVATAIHAVICFIITIAALGLCKFDSGIKSNMIITVTIFIVIYAVIFIATYISFRNEAKKINKKLMK